MYGPVMAQNGEPQMYLVYSPSRYVIEPCSADCAQYLAGTREAIVSGPSVCVWIVPGTMEY